MLNTPPRNGKIINPPFNMYARSPTLGLLLLQLGEYLRYNSSLPPRLSEFAIMIAARQWSQLYEWRAHYPLAIKGGLDRAVLVSLGEGRRPDAMKPDEAAVYEFSTEMYREKKVSDATFHGLLNHLGERGMMDVIGILGYYDLVSMALITEEATGSSVGEPPLVQLAPK